MARQSRSVRRQIVASFAVLIVLFGGAAGWSFWQQRAAARSLRLANEGYLRLSVELGTQRANQGILDTLVDLLPDARDRVALRAWISLTRRSRRPRLARARGLIDASLRVATDPDDVALLRGARATLTQIDATYAEDELLFDLLFQSLSGSDRAATLRLKETLLSRENECERTLARLVRDIQGRVQRLADHSERTQAVSLRGTLLAAVLAMLVGALTIARARAALAPLEALRDRAQAVARGDLSAVTVEARDDEIGELAAEFERMVATLSARDEMLRRANAEKLQAERLAAIGRMAAHVTHEVRNPLSSMALNTEMLAEEVSGGEAARLVGAIQREIDRLTTITEEYLRVARLPRPRLEPEDLGDLVQEAAGFVRRELSAAGVELDVDVAPSLPTVRVDEGQMRQVLLNLLRNAREAMEAAQSETRRVTVRARRAPRGAVDGVEVSVSDTGPGLPESAREHLFELFFTTKERGTGLGLPLSREVVLAHGGEITASRADADEGGGARFVIWLPVTTETSDADRRAEG